MAEEKKGGGNAFINSLSKGMSKDTAQATQPEATYTWALNAINESELGDFGFLTNEEGNFACGQLAKVIATDDWAVIGGQYIENDRVIAFLAPKNPSDFGKGRIVEIREDCSSTVLITADCLDFKMTKQIQCIYRIRNGCEVNLYWTDDYNDIRHLNLSSLTDYLKVGFKQSDIDAGTNDSIWDCENMKIWPDYDMPDIKFLEFNESGSLPAGAYQFAVQYLDQDFNPTNWTDLSQPVPVYSSPSTNSELQIKGSKSGSVNPDGSVDWQQTNKAIVLSFNNLDTSFKYLRIAAWPSTGGLGENLEGGRLIGEIGIGNTTETFTFGTYDVETTSFIHRDELTVARKIYQKAKTLEQSENRLLLGNLASQSLDHLQLTRNALAIQSNYVTKALSTEDASDDSVQSGSYYFDYRSYMRDEIYAFGIVWIFKDGSESPVYHIPGRAKDKRSDGSSIANASYNDHNRPNATGGSWDSTILHAAGADTSLDMNVNAYTPDVITRDGSIERWEIYNTAIQTSSGFESETLLGDTKTKYTNRGEFAYFECRNSRYPATLDCEGVPIFPVESGSVSGGDLVMGKVRHHKFPDTTLEAHQYGDGSIRYSRLDLLSNNPMPVGRTAINTIGVQFSNISCPQDMANRVQGYKIVKSIQNDQDKTVIDKGIFYYIHTAMMTWAGEDFGKTPGQCNFLMQGNMRNKHISNFACVHHTFSNTGSGDGCTYDNWTTDSSSLWENSDGTTNIQMGMETLNPYRNMYNPAFEYGGKEQRTWSGFVLENSCIGCMNNADGIDCGFMGAAVVYGNLAGICQGDFTSNADFIRGGDGYPHPGWGWYVEDDSYTSTGTAGINIGMLVDVVAYPNAVVGYHGPAAKFGNLRSPDYMKIERVLQGYSVNIYCNNGCCNNDKDGSHKTGGDSSGVGKFVDGRDDDSSTYIYTKCTYHHSAIPYSNIRTGFSNMYEPSGSGLPWAGFGQAGAAWDQDSAGVTLWEYNESLTNVNIFDNVHLEANSGEHFIPTFGDSPMNMHSQMEVDLMVFKRQVGTDYHFWRIPYPGNNTGRNEDTPNGEISANGDAYSAVHCQNLETNSNGSASGGNGDHSGSQAFGNQFDGRSTVYYASLKKHSYDAYGNLGSLIYIPTGNNIHKFNSAGPLSPQKTTSVFGGDTFISRFAFKQTNHNKACGTEIKRAGKDKCIDKDHLWYPKNSGNVVREKRRDRTNKENRILIANHVSWYWTESYINTELRCGIDINSEMFYPFHFEGGDYGLMSFVDDIGYMDGGGGWGTGIGDGFSPNSYIMNNDYHKLNNENIFVPLPLQFDFCSSCHEDYPFRIAYSEQGFQEEQKDLFKSFLTNNYRDIPAHRGEIWNMWTLDNAIFVHTKEALWRVDPSRNVMNPSDGERSVYIGTGDFFSTPIKEILQSETGYLGCQSQWATQKTESGVFWPDHVQGHIFMQQQDPKDIAMAGMRNWFEENMEMEIYKQYKTIYGVDFPFIDNPANPSGAGYTSVYDQRHSRYIVGKRDYKLHGSWATIHTGSPYYQVISADSYTGNWVVSGGSNAVCNCVPNYAWSSNAGYAVVNATDPSTSEEACKHTYSLTTVEVITVPQDTDIWVFYDKTSIDSSSANAANREVIDWVAAQQSAGGILENWAGNLFHVTMGDERWVEWPRQAMGHGGLTVNNGYGFDVYPSTGIGTYVSPNAICLVLHDETHSRYHDASPSSSYGGEKTASWNSDYADYVSKYDTYTATGKGINSLIYPVCTQMNGNKEVFVLHAFSAVYGDEASALPTGTNSFGAGRPDTVTGNSLQTGLGAGIQVDLLPAMGGGNPYDGDEPLKNKGWDGRWDKRSSSDFGTLGGDLTSFVQDLSSTITTVTNYTHYTPCIYEGITANNAPCGCEDTLDSPITITLNDSSTVTVTKLSEIFECKGWTASYNIGTNTWISFHSYMPNYYIAARNFFYSGMNYRPESKHAHRHGLNTAKGNFQTYYGCLYPHVIDLVSNDSPLIVNNYNSLKFVTDAYIWDQANENWHDMRSHTFDKVVLYNSYQSSGEQDFNVVGAANSDAANTMTSSVGDVANTIRLQRSERTWKANGFRDLATSRFGEGVSLWSKSWSNLSTSPYMDHVVNPLGVDTLKTWTDQARFTDKYLGIRLIFSNLVSPGNIKLVTNYVQSTASISTR